MAIVKGTNGLSLNIQHDYITLRTPNGNFTTSWCGSKASGKLAQNNKAFNALDNYVQTEGKKTSFGDAMNNLLKPEILSTLWSDWNATVKKNTFVPGDVVKFESNSLFAKKYPKGGIVQKVSRVNVFIKLADKNEVCGFDYQTLVKQ